MICDCSTTTVGATGLPDGPPGLVMAAVLSMVAPGATLATVTSNTTCTLELAGTVMPLTESWVALDASTLPGGRLTTVRLVVFAGSGSETETLAAVAPADSVNVIV